MCYKNTSFYYWNPHNIHTGFNLAHNHPPNPATLEYNKVPQHIKKRCREMTTPVPAIYKQEIAKLRTPEWNDDTQRMLQYFTDLEAIALWCIPQNRNSIMCTALHHFLQHTPSALKIIEHKFCAPGHSSIQELDSVHSHIEKSLNLSEIFSSFSFVRVLSKVKGDP